MALHGLLKCLRMHHPISVAKFTNSCCVQPVELESFGLSPISSCPDLQSEDDPDSFDGGAGAATSQL